MKEIKEKQKLYEKNRRYPHQIKFRVSDKIYIELSKIAESKGNTITDVCRDRINGLKYEPSLINFKDSKKIIRGISIMGSNLNQTTKALNTISLYLKRKMSKEQKRFQFDSLTDLFMDEQANKIADKLKVKKPEDLFNQKNITSFYYTFLNREEQNLLIKWINEPLTRPINKQQFERSLQQNIHLVSINIQKMKDDLEKLCQLL